MRKLWALLLLACLTCTPEYEFSVNGEWSLDRLEAQEDYYLPGLFFTTDTVFSDVDFYFDSLEVYTIVNGTIDYVPVIGYHFENKWSHTYEWQDTSIWIGVEEWKVLQADMESMIIENLTVYGIVGEIRRTLYFTRK